MFKSLVHKENIMSDNTETIWAYAKEHKVPFDTVMVARKIVESDPKLDIFAVMLYPTDEQSKLFNCNSL